MTAFRRQRRISKILSPTGSVAAHLQIQTGVRQGDWGSNAPGMGLPGADPLSPVSGQRQWGRGGTRSWCQILIHGLPGSCAGEGRGRRVMSVRRARAMLCASGAAAVPEQIVDTKIVVVVSTVRSPFLRLLDRRLAKPWGEHGAARRGRYGAALPVGDESAWRTGDEAARRGAAGTRRRGGDEHRRGPRCRH